MFLFACYLCSCYDSETDFICFYEAPEGECTTFATELGLTHEPLGVYEWTDCTSAYGMCSIDDSQLILFVGKSEFTADTGDLFGGAKSGPLTVISKNPITISYSQPSFGAPETITFTHELVLIGCDLKIPASSSVFGGTEAVSFDGGLSLERASIVTDDGTVTMTVTNLKVTGEQEPFKSTNNPVTVDGNIQLPVNSVMTSFPSDVTILESATLTLMLTKDYPYITFDESNIVFAQNEASEGISYGSGASLTSFPSVTVKSEIAEDESEFWMTFNAQPGYTLYLHNIKNVHKETEILGENQNVHLNQVTFVVEPTSTASADKEFPSETTATESPETGNEGSETGNQSLPDEGGNDPSSPGNDGMTVVGDNHDDNEGSPGGKTNVGAIVGGVVAAVVVIVVIVVVVVVLRMRRKRMELNTSDAMYPADTAGEMESRYELPGE